MPLPLRRRIAAALCGLLLAGCAPTGGPPRRAGGEAGTRPGGGSGTEAAAGAASGGATSAVRAAAADAASASAWLAGTHPTAAAVVARIVARASDPAHGPEIPVYVAALGGECASAVPAVGEALPPLADEAVVGAGYAPADALAQVLVRCPPPPAGAAAGHLAASLLAYVRGPDPDAGSPHLPAALGKDVPAGGLLAALPALTAAGAFLVAESAPTPDALFRLLAAGQDLATAPAIVGAAAALPDATLEGWLAAPQLTAREVRLRLLWEVRGTSPASPAFATWLRGAAETEADPAVAEAMWSRLYLTDHDPAALAALNRLADADGTFRIDVPGINVWDWHVLRPAVAADPSGYLARGVAAYEAVEGGRPYFAVDRCPGTGPCQPFVYGDAQFDPAREIPGWEAFLKQYGAHPAAADAAYRLARCEEILGRWGAALRDMEAAAQVYPDGQIASAAQGRLDFMLDVEIPDAALAALAASPPTPALATAIAYAVGVRELRAGEYARAAADLRGHPPSGAPVYSWLQWPLAASASEQRREAAAIAALAPRAFPDGYDPEPPSGIGGPPRADFAEPPVVGDPQAAYRIGQILFHDDLALYNELWQGAQQQFYAFGGGINSLVAGDLRPQWRQQFLASNTYVEAEPIFAAIAADAAAPEALRAKAAYSAGECLVHLDGYNVVLGQLIAAGTLRAKIIATFRAFAAEFPRAGDLVPDALLTVARYTRAPADIQAVTSGFPGTWQAQAAAGLLGTGTGGGSGGAGPGGMGPGGAAPGGGSLGSAGGSLGSSGLAFEEVGAAGVAPGSGSGARVLADGWTTVVVAPPGLPVGDGVAIQGVIDLGSGAAVVRWVLQTPGQGGRGALPWMEPSPVEEIEVPAVLTAVTFAGPGGG